MSIIAKLREGLPGNEISLISNFPTEYRIWTSGGGGVHAMLFDGIAFVQLPRYGNHFCEVVLEEMGYEVWPVENLHPYREVARKGTEYFRWWRYSAEGDEFLLENPDFRPFGWEGPPDEFLEKFFFYGDEAVISSRFCRADIQEKVGDLVFHGTEDQFLQWLVEKNCATYDVLDEAGKAMGFRCHSLASLYFQLEKRGIPFDADNLYTEGDIDKLIILREKTKVDTLYQEYQKMTGPMSSEKHAEYSAALKEYIEVYKKHYRPESDDWK